MIIYTNRRFVYSWDRLMYSACAKDCGLGAYVSIMAASISGYTFSSVCYHSANSNSDHVSTMPPDFEAKCLSARSHSGTTNSLFHQIRINSFPGVIFLVWLQNGRVSKPGELSIQTAFVSIAGAFERSKFRVFGIFVVFHICGILDITSLIELTQNAPLMVNKMRSRQVAYYVLRRSQGDSQQTYKPTDFTSLSESGIAVYLVYRRSLSYNVCILPGSVQ